MRGVMVSAIRSDGYTVIRFCVSIQLHERSSNQVFVALVYAVNQTGIEVQVSFKHPDYTNRKLRQRGRSGWLLFSTRSIFAQRID